MNLILIEIREDTFEELINSGSLSISDIVVMDQYHQGIPEITANLRLISQLQKDATTSYRETMKKIDVLKEKNDKLKL